MANKNDSFYMSMALQLARKGLGKTSPNPCVGAILVKNGEIVGRGYHKKAGTPHGEVHALREAGPQAAGATLYVTLEPCNHTGRTPPCTQAILAAGVSRVVVGMEDPNPLVSGAGISCLRQQGLQVDTGILEAKCQALNRFFCKYITTGLPFVAMKAGVSLDGRLSYQHNRQGWMTGAESQRQVHRLRGHYDAILVGSQTVRIDNPALTVRLASGGYRNPRRVILDSQLSLSLQSKVFSSKASDATIIFCSEQAPDAKRRLFADRGVAVYVVSQTAFGLDLSAVLRQLGQLNCISLLVEGGGRVHGSFLQQQFYDHAYLFIAPLFAGDGGQPLLNGLAIKERNAAPYLQDAHLRRLGRDYLMEGKIAYPAGVTDWEKSS